MTKRRGNGEGSISKRRDGRWQGLYTVQTADGPKQKSVYGKKRADVARKLTEAMAARDRGMTFEDRGLTVGEYLGRWLEDVVQPNKAHRTYAAHRQQLRSHIFPTLGHLKLRDLRKHHIDRLYREKLDSGLASSTVRRVHAVLHAALEEAVRGDLILRNPAAYANKPTARTAEREPLDAGQALKLLDACRGSRYEALYVLCLTTGLRQGEALALRWYDVDFETGSLSVVRQVQRVRRDGEVSGRLEFSEPKNASRRRVGLAERAVEALKDHAQRQAREIEEAGDFYEDGGLIFASSTGGPLDAQNVVNRHFKPLLERIGLPSVRFHDLRHTCLSLLAESGEPIRDLQALAGHATAAFTLQRYTHHYDTSAHRTARAMDSIFPREEP